MKQISGFKVDIFVGFRIEELSTFDEDQSCWKVDTPGQSRSGHHNLNKVFDKEFLTKLTITVVKTGMMESNTKAKSLFEELIVSPFDCSFKHFRITKNIWRLLTVFHLAVCYQIAGCESSLSSGGYKDDNRFAIAELFDVIEGRFIHGCHSRTIMFLTEAFEVNFNRNRSD